MRARLAEGCSASQIYVLSEGREQIVAPESRDGGGSELSRSYNRQVSVLGAHLYRNKILSEGGGSLPRWDSWMYARRLVERLCAGSPFAFFPLPSHSHPLLASLLLLSSWSQLVPPCEQPCVHLGVVERCGL